MATATSSASDDARHVLTRLLTRTDPSTAAANARRLLTEFETFAAILAASDQRLAALVGLAAAGEIRLHRDVTMCALQSRFASRPVLANRQALLDYLRVELAFSTVERVRVLHLDVQNRLLRDELVAEGTIDEAAVYVREIVRRALELGSAFLILAHNHPSGVAKASRADIALTRNLVEAARLFRITLIDHLIVTADGTVSLKQAGVL